MNDCRSPLKPPVLLTHVELGLVHGMSVLPRSGSPTQRLSPPLLPPCQNRRLPGCPPAIMPPRKPAPSIAKLSTASVNGIELPEVPSASAVMTTKGVVTPLMPAFTHDAKTRVARTA